MIVCTDYSGGRHVAYNWADTGRRLLEADNLASVGFGCGSEKVLFLESCVIYKTEHYTEPVFVCGFTLGGYPYLLKDCEFSIVDIYPVVSCSLEVDAKESKQYFTHIHVKAAVHTLSGYGITSKLASPIFVDFNIMETPNGGISVQHEVENTWNR